MSNYYWIRGNWHYNLNRILTSNGIRFRESLAVLGSPAHRTSETIYRWFDLILSIRQNLSTNTSYPYTTLLLYPCRSQPATRKTVTWVRPSLLGSASGETTLNSLCSAPPSYPPSVYPHFGGISQCMSECKVHNHDSLFVVAQAVDRLVLNGNINYLYFFSPEVIALSRALSSQLAYPSDIGENPSIVGGNPTHDCSSTIEGKPQWYSSSVWKSLLGKLDNLWRKYRPFLSISELSYSWFIFSASLTPGFLLLF